MEHDAGAEAAHAPEAAYSADARHIAARCRAVAFSRQADAEPRTSDEDDPGEGIETYDGTEADDAR